MKEDNWTRRSAAAARAFTSIEPLESRIAPSTFLVTNIKNAGAGSLRDAIDHANAAPGADNIAFTGKARGTILLKGALPVIHDDLTITGPGAGKLTIDGQGRRQIFAISNNYSDDGTGAFVTTPTDVTISGLKLAHGRGFNGGAIAIDNPGGHVLLQFSKLSGNKAIGFEKPLILTLMLVEFMLLTIIGGAMGGFGARVLFKMVDMGKVTQGFLQNFEVGPYPIAVCLITSTLVGLVAGGLPAMRASSMSVVDGLRRGV